MVYYARLSLVFLVTMAILSAVGLALVHAMGDLVLPISVGDFRGGLDRAIRRATSIEGKKPSFFEDLRYLWVGPLFVLSKLFVRLGVRW